VLGEKNVFHDFQKVKLPTNRGKIDKGPEDGFAFNVLGRFFRLKNS